MSGPVASGGRLRALGRHRWGLRASALLGLLPLGCSHELTLGDCETVRARIESAWQADANEAASLADNEQVRRYIKDEANRLGQAWMRHCRERVGQKADAREVACLRRVEHIDDVARCASR